MNSPVNECDGFPPAFFWGVIEDPSLTDEEWAEVCERSKVRLTADLRQKIDNMLWGCNWQKVSLTFLPRTAELKKTLRAFVKAANMLLESAGYLQAARISSVADRPPFNTRMGDTREAQAWQAICRAAGYDAWRWGPATKLALERANSPLDALQAVHALAFTADWAIKCWPKDPGGKRSGGDRDFVRSLLIALDDAGIKVGFSYDSVEEQMEGPGWRVLSEIWCRRRDVFTTEEPSSLATLYRSVHSKFHGSFFK